MPLSNAPPDNRASEKSHIAGEVKSRYSGKKTETGHARLPHLGTFENWGDFIVKSSF